MELQLQPVQELELPEGSRIMCLQNQKGSPFIWFWVPEPRAQKKKIILRTVGTGEQCAVDNYVGTYKVNDGNLVFHVFIKKRTCSGCGCTDDNCSQCVEKTGEPCYWVSEDLCSACFESNQPEEKTDYKSNSNN